jgi:hypothetical protein
MGEGSALPVPNEDNPSNVTATALATDKDGDSYENPE